MEEERELELEKLYESGIVETMNRSDQAIGSGVLDNEGGIQPTSEATAVSKQTSETLMAGERIMEALDLADGERAALLAFNEEKAKLPPSVAEKLPPPTKNAVLAAHNMEPDQYVLMVVEKINGTALMDALLVLPFGKVLSLMVYLDEWSKKVCYSKVTLQDLIFTEN